MRAATHKFRAVDAKAAEVRVMPGRDGPIYLSHPRSRGALPCNLVAMLLYCGRRLTERSFSVSVTQ